MDRDGSETEIAGLRRELEELKEENRRLRSQLGLEQATRPEVPLVAGPRRLPLDDSGTGLGQVTQASSPEDKLSLFVARFAGRDDVYALRWENQRTGRSGWGPAVKGGWHNVRRKDRELLLLTREVLASHLRGDQHVGIYPLRSDDRTHLLACDFDGTSWLLDALAYRDAAAALGVPVAIERSRSGDGAHAWTFFTDPVSASAARRIGFGALREAMAMREEIDLASYDRLFPAQDFMPRGSFGNLIALPLQGRCRRGGTTVFLDPSTNEPCEDQWAFLASVDRLTAEDVAALAERLADVDAGPASKYRRPRMARGDVKAPERVRAVVGAKVAIDRVGLPPALLALLKHLASLHNPKFYENERLRFSNHKTPRFIRCYREQLDTLLLPRGLVEPARQLVAAAGGRFEATESFAEPFAQQFEFGATLSPVQQRALERLREHDLGVFVAPPGTGKTVLACALIADRAVPTLVIADRRLLVAQWCSRLQEHLGIAKDCVGQLGGEKDRASGIVDVAMAQSLARREDLEEVTAGYGLVVVDECHHVPAVTFERCVRQIPVKRWLGLTATPYRRDHLEALITMYCGPTRYDATSDVAEGLPAVLELIVHPTSYQEAADDSVSIQAIFRGLVEDDARTEQICADVAEAVRRRRNCLVLTQWTEHLERIAEGLTGAGNEPLVLRGGIGKKASAAVMEELGKVEPGSGVVLVATGGYLGEGFDCPPLDSLFLAFPIRFKGRVVQYVGRVMRPAEGKRTVEVHDYVDAAVPVLERMHASRAVVLRTLGFEPRSADRMPLQRVRPVSAR
ncbi:MAG: TOTE conflict system archaeo-eukaryotic primase domain-containing protein [Acidimicrobiales bacterium]